MQKSNEDCYYFLTSSCAKGPACSYRHNAAVLTCNVMCPAWLRGSCIDPYCQLRHSAIQRPTLNPATLCYYENTPMGCLKLDCTYAHLRPRPTLRSSPIARPSTTNLVNKDLTKTTNPAVSSTPPIVPPLVTNDPIPTPEVEPLQTSMPKVEAPVPNGTSLPTTSNESVSSRITNSIENGQTETSNSKTVTNSSDDTISKTITQSRVVVNRNVVIAESPNTSSRKIVQGTTNRIVVSADTINSTKEIKNDSDSDLDDLVQQEEDDMKRTNTVIDISFPCSAPSITNRFSTPNKPITTSNDTKPVRLNRDRLPAAKITIFNSPTSNGEQTSAGTVLLQEDERRASRIERFKKSTPQSVVNTPPSTSTTTRNVIATSTNERKRPLQESSTKDARPSKRRSSQQENNQQHNATTIGDLCPSVSNQRRVSDRRRSSSSFSSSSSSSSSSSPSHRKSPPRPTFRPKSSMDDLTWKRQVDEFIARTTQPKPSTPIPLFPSQPVPLLSLRPRFIPPPPQQYQQKQKPMNSRFPSNSQRPRQASNAPVKHPPPPPVVNKSPPIPSKPVEQPSTSTITTNQSSDTLKDEDENKLLEFDEPSDVVDTFAFIDDALLETDLLELM